MKLATPLTDILCTNCREPELESSGDHLLYYETSVAMGGGGPPTISLDVKRVSLQRVGPSTFAATAVVAPHCPDCDEPHELRYYLQAVEVFIRGVQRCPKCSGDMELRQQDLSYDEDDSGPRIILKGDLYCPRCGKSIPAVTGYTAPAFEKIASAGAVVVDLETTKATALRADVRVHRFKVALSFPGNQREFVRQVAEELASALGNDHVFYDMHFEAELARPNLDTYLQYIYQNESQLVAIFLSAECEQRDWCHLEWRAVRDLIQRRSGEVMLLRFDSFQPAGLFRTTEGFLEIGKREPREVAALILRRLKDGTPRAG